MDESPRRRFLRTAGSALAAGLAGCTLPGDEAPSGETTTPTDAATDTDPGGGTATPTDTDTETDQGTTTGGDGGLDGLEVAAERVAQGFTSPVAIEIPEPGRRFVVDQKGLVYLQDRTGVREDPFLDVRDRMVDVSGYDERGLLGMAFHPDYPDTPKCYVRYSAPRREGTPEGYSHTFVLSEFEAPGDAVAADPDTERTVLEIPQPQSNHNAGAVAFGPDGYLYVAVGDGGGANDQGTGHVDDWYGENAGGNGQDVTENLLGSVLRIDVDGREAGKGYAVPDDNPLVGGEGLDEHYAWGFRNPWRLSFGPDGRLFAADVGQGAWEEVDVVEKGGNYGWNVREGAHCFRAEDCPAETPDGDPLLDPVIEYPHGGAPVSGISVIGGYLYDGDGMPDLRGRYVFADWQAGGDLFVAEPDGEGLWDTAVLPVSGAGDFGPNVLSFGANPAGELFVCTTAKSGVTGTTGRVFRLTAPA